MALVREFKDVMSGYLLTQPSSDVKQVLAEIGMNVLDQVRFMRDLEELKQSAQVHLKGATSFILVYLRAARALSNLTRKRTLVE